MLRKRFQKFLPSHESVRRNRYIAFFGSALHHHNLWHLNRRSVAGGVAVGLFCGLVPGPLQMLSAALLSVIVRVNLPVALVSTLYTNPFTIVPLYFVAYKLGTLVVGNGAGAVAPPHRDLSWSDLGQWIPLLLEWMTAMGKPFAVGLPLLASILAATGYLAVQGAWRLSVRAAWRKRALSRAGARPPTASPKG
jgi:uncharacterized protein (DUF2062 family)